MRQKLVFGRYDYAGYAAFLAYAMCSLAIPLTIVEMGKSLNFPLDAGGMSDGGILHLMRSIAIVAALLGCGIVAGRIGKRKCMGTAMLFMGAGILLCAITPCYALLLPFLLIAGLGEGICEGAATPFVQVLHNDAPERYVNIAHSMWSVGIACSVFFSGFLLAAGISWRIVLAGCGLAAIAASLMFLWKEKPGKEYPEAKSATSAKDVFRYTAAISKNFRFWVYCFGMFMGAGAEFCTTFWSAAYLRLTCNAGAGIAAAGTGSFAAGMFLGRLLSGYFAKKNNLKHILLFFAIGTIPVTSLLVFLKPEMFPSAWMLYGVMFVILFFCGFGVAPYWPTLQVYGVGNLPELDSTMLYIYFSAMGIPGCGFFTWIMGILGDHYGLRGAFLMIPVSLVIFVMTIFLEAWIFPRKDLPEKTP